MPRIKAVIFDMDGVLIDAKDWHFTALNRALDRFGFQITREEHDTTFDGLPTLDKLELLSTSQSLPRSLHSRINELKQTYTMELVNERCRPRHEHELALRQLRTEGFKLAVASNSVRASVETMMQLSNLAPLFDTMVSNQDVERAKPNPEIYLKTMALLNVQANEVLVVEDHEHGIASARSAGAHIMVVQNPEEVTLDNIRRHITQAESTF